MGSLYINKNYIIINNNGRYSVVCRISFKHFTINEDAFKVIKYIQERGSLNLSEIDNIAVISFIKQLSNYGIITNNKQESGFDNIKESRLKPGLKRVFLEITKKCNLRCKHCFNSSGIECEDKEQLTTEEVKRLINMAHEMGVWQFDLTGGEPFLRKDIFEILEYLNQKAMAVTLFSNLTVLDYEKIKILKDLKIRKVITSLDGYSDVVHDGFRGVKGCKQKTIDNIKILRRFGIDVSVNVIIGNHNIKELDKLINYLKFDLKIPFTPDIILPIGRGNNLLDYDKYAELLGYLHYIKGKDYKCSIQNRGKFELPYQEHCGIAENFLYITSDGKVNLCPSLTYRENADFSFGNIKETNLEDAWKQIILCYGSLACEKRVECEAKNKCKGGCRSRAYSAYGSVSAADKSHCIMYGVEDENEKKSD
ncbi:MAG: radical SAM protein [Halanaerobiales bacterium]|nr:radical SAM protein [Halanaerobiales bacterium]